jgi:hypothetical protein
VSVNLKEIKVTGYKKSVFPLSFFCVLLIFLGFCGEHSIPQSIAQVKPVNAIPEETDNTPVPADKLFPESVKGFVAIQDLKLLAEQWKKTQIGLLMNDPIMKPFQEDFKIQLEKRMENRFGLNLDGIEQLPSGEVAFGMVAIPETTPGYVFTMDTADRRKQAADYIERLTKKFLKIGVKKTTEKYKDDEIIVFTFPDSTLNPNKKDEKDKEKDNVENTNTSSGNINTSRRTPSNRQPTPRPQPASRPRNIKESAKPKEDKKNNDDDKSDQRKAYYLLKDDYLVISNQLHLIRLFADRISEGHEVKNSLSDVKEYQEVLNRCLSNDQPADSLPLIHWYIEPLNYGESMRILLRRTDSEKRKNKKSIFTSLKEQGFDAIGGVGGTVSIKTKDREVAYRVFVHANKPYRLAMKMFNLPNGTNFTPPKWISVDVARCSVLLVEPLTIFDNVGTLFDELVAQGEAGGVFNDIITGLREDPRGPQVDVREEFIVNLGGRAFTMSNYSKPISPDSESIVIAIELKEPEKNKKEGELDPAEKIKKAVDKIFNNDSDMTKTEHKGYVIWHRAPVQEIKLPTVDGIPALGSETDVTNEQNNSNDDTPPIFPEGGITVTPKYLLASTNVEYLKTIIDRLEINNSDNNSDSIIEHVDYKATNEVLKTLNLDKRPHFAQFFSKSDESLEPTYEMIRQGKMPQSKAILGKLINAILVPDNENGTVREQEFNWNKLPEFEKVRHAFGPAALYGESVENGFFFEGFLLKKANVNGKKDQPKDQPKENKDEKENEK